MLWFVSTAAAQESLAQNSEKTLRVYDWKDLPAQFPNSQIISMDGISVLKIENTIENTNKTPLEILFLTTRNSSLIKKANRIEWEMKYENVGNFTNRGVENFWAGWKLSKKFPPQAVGGDSPTNYIGWNFVGTRNWAKYDFVIGRAPHDNQTHPGLESN